MRKLFVVIVHFCEIGVNIIGISAGRRIRVSTRCSLCACLSLLSLLGSSIHLFADFIEGLLQFFLFCFDRVVIFAL